MGERELVAVRIESEAAMGDPPRALHRRRLDHQEPRAGDREAAEMHPVPVGGAAVIGAVLAHRRDDDAIRQGEAAQGNRCEELARHAGSLRGFQKVRYRARATLWARLGQRQSRAHRKTYASSAMMEMGLWGPACGFGGKNAGGGKTQEVSARQGGSADGAAEPPDALALIRNRGTN